MDCFKFSKICKDCNLIDRQFGPADADIIFTQVLRDMREIGSTRKIDLHGFQEALKLIADKKGVEEEAIFKAVAGSNGPNIVCTKAESVRHHDDLTLYTGTHAFGGPDAGKKSKGTGLVHPDVACPGLRKS